MTYNMLICHLFMIFYLHLVMKLWNDSLCIPHLNAEQDLVESNITAFLDNHAVITIMQQASQDTQTLNKCKHWTDRN